MVSVILPGLRGSEAYAQMLYKAKELRKKYGIRFDRDAMDEYEAICGILDALDSLLSGGTGRKGRRTRRKKAVDLEEIKKAVSST